ncbi:YfaP family protein [Maribacter sp. 1_MG-2023]|uniref:YfaP family protein n=1 Tax=Maribacter sp. 1_MG-2023 TaxID=3062677 RepID=UPI0026E17668|nr:hypothetical protein [Maribacter sp. 1_MG-2023]MDO6470228.1 hypothetical protein [Maribacter sp. 1_MG-2023]
MKKNIVLLSFLAIILSCNKTNDTTEIDETSTVETPTDEVPIDNGTNFDNINVSFNEVNSQEGINYSNLLQSTITISNDIQISTFGQIGVDGFATGIEKIYTYNATEGIESIMLLDDNNEPSFIYGVDIATGEKSSGVTEFERIDINSFYVRLYDYDWTNRLGTLLFETIITKNGDTFTSSPVFETTTNTTSKSNKSGTSFKIPIFRLDNFESGKSHSQTLRSSDLINDWVNDLTDFRNNQIPEFLGVLKDVGIVATLGAGAAVLVGSAGAAPLFIGAAALTATATALEFFISDDFSDFIEEVQSDFSDIGNDVNSNISSLVEIIEGYSDNTSTFLNDNLNQLSTSEILDDIEDFELLVNNENLNDLPDSNGVLQIGLSWNTNNTDIDLHVVDPLGTTIFWENPTSSSGGFLDRDDIDGFGPENIFWNGNYPDGIYSVSVVYFGCELDICPSTSYTIKISDGLGFQQSFSGSLSSENDSNLVSSFEVVNGQIIISM